MTGMFEPRLTPDTLRAEPVARSYRDLADVGTDRRDRAAMAEWGHAAVAPTEKPARTLGQPPFTP